MSDSFRPSRLWPTRLLCPWDAPGRNTGLGCHALLQGTFPIQGLNPGFPHRRWILYLLSQQGSHYMFIDTCRYLCINIERTKCIMLSVLSFIKSNHRLCFPGGSEWRSHLSMITRLGLVVQKYRLKYSVLLKHYIVLLLTKK